MRQETEEQIRELNRDTERVRVEEDGLIKALDNRLKGVTQQVFESAKYCKLMGWVSMLPAEYGRRLPEGAEGVVWGLRVTEVALSLQRVVLFPEGDKAFLKGPKDLYELYPTYEPPPRIILVHIPIALVNLVIHLNQKALRLYSETERASMCLSRIYKALKDIEP